MIDSTIIYIVALGILFYLWWNNNNRPKYQQETDMSEKEQNYPSSNVIQFPTVKEGDMLKEMMGKMESEIKTKLDALQVLNEDIVDLTIQYEAMLYRLCELTGVKLPNDPDWSNEWNDEQYKNDVFGSTKTMVMTYRKYNLTGLRTKKCTSQGQGGRGRRVKIATSTMNKNRKRSHKKYRGQGR